ncbi:MAG: ABC transporter ATP-binding protein [Cyclobacteriaceae bacterium]|nr:ABC transporter ATP-binding protein [Cyclobacteriaceae bacterium]
MMSVVIRVEHLSKAYQLGQIGTGTLSRDLERWWITKVRGKEDPFLKIGEVNDRTLKSDNDVVLALNDISFEVNAGEVLGIIGRNGAGKSTLLKILSRTTSPTRGEVKIKGRIASLLEVGTGFHPDLTGRENIFLNGAIMGMAKQEITKKFDEIVAFAGVERYIDTPVKRYSSGMYVRLAFAVAAHLEPEILVVDEVLAVGDAEFQKKCFGKMDEVSKTEGRTVLLVSHQMGTIAQICTKALQLKNGTVSSYGHPSTVINNYLSGLQNEGSNKYFAEASKNQVYFQEVLTVDSEGQPKEEFSFKEKIFLKAKIKLNQKLSEFRVSVTLQNLYGNYVSTSVYDLTRVSSSTFEVLVGFPEGIIAPNSYYFRVAVFTSSIVYEVIENICQIQIIDTGSNLAQYEGQNYGSVILNTDWKISSN